MSGMRPRCTHCGVRPSRLRNGLCQADDAYRRKYGRLPGEQVMIRRGMKALVNHRA